ncbi:hypothetical protein [uncultured Rothia sp.]|uniref:hypothetical protein n=1 Tax=uncultured Rothia sp. TaxID=316088 RepID=UPI00321648B0
MSKRSLIQHRDSYSLCVLGIWNKLYSWVRNLNIYVQVILIFAVSRILGWALFTIVGKQETYSPWSQRPMSYFNFVNIWDADWYRRIAESGYPTQLPVNEAGEVTENQWAFYPLYPIVNGAISRVTGLEYQIVAALVSLISGFIVACLMFWLFRLSVSACLYLRAGIEQRKPESAPQNLHERAESTALWGVSLFAFAPIAPVLQVAYAESFNLIFLLATLIALLQKKYWWAAELALPAALSRPIGVPLGATAGLLWLIAVIDDAGRSSTLREPNRWVASFLHHLPQLGSALLICSMALLWPFYAWMRTGQMDAYTATETAWRGSDLFLVMPWFEQSIKYFGLFGPFIFIGLTVAFIGFLTSKPARQTLHPVLWMWCTCYVAYLVLFLNPQSSLFRMLLPLFPLVLVIVELSTSRAYRFLLMLTGAILQFGWVGWLWHWKQLPGGGDYPP